MNIPTLHEALKISFYGGFKMKKYECIKALDLEKFDEDGSLVDGELMTIQTGTMWAVDEKSYKFIANNDAIRLLEVTDKNSQQWLEIHKDTLENHFTIKE